MRIVTVTEAKSKLNELVEEAASTHQQVTITRHGRPGVVMLAAEDFESLQETIFWLSQPGIHDSLLESDADIAAGRVLSTAEVRAELGLA
jgi:antitoxin YefM